MFARVVGPVVGTVLFAALSGWGEAFAHEPPAAAPPAQPVQAPDTHIISTPPSSVVPTTMPAEPGQGPQIVFDTPTYEFGRIMSGEPIRHDFWFTNRGNATLEVTAVRPGCGCTVAGDWDRRVEPGKTGKIPIVLRTENMNSKIQKNINVTTNVPGQPEIVLWVKGDVWLPIELQPAYINFGSITETDKPRTQVVKMINRLDTPIDPKNVKSNNPLFRVDLKPITEGKEYEMTVSLLPPMPTGSQAAVITLDTGNEKSPKLTANATAYIPARVEVQPQKLLIPSPLTMDLERAVYVTYNAGDDLKLTDVKMSDPKVPLRVVEDPPRGKRYRIVVKFPAGYEIASGSPPRITFQTSDPSAKEVIVPVEAIKVPSAQQPQQAQARVPIGQPVRIPPATQPAVPSPDRLR